MSTLTKQSKKPFLAEVVTKEVEGQKELILSGYYHGSQLDKSQITTALRFGGIIESGDCVSVTQPPENPFLVNGTSKDLAKTLFVISGARGLKINYEKVPSLDGHIKRMIS